MRQQEKCLSLEPRRGIFCKTQEAQAGCQINPIDVNFHIQKSLEVFDKNSADKIQFKKGKEIKLSPLMLESNASNLNQNAIF